MTTCEDVTRYLSDGVERATFCMSVTDAHPTHRDVFDGVIILRGNRQAIVNERISTRHQLNNWPFYSSDIYFIFKIFFRPSHPTGHDGINFSRVSAAQCHQISVKRPDSLKSKPDVTS